MHKKYKSLCFLWGCLFVCSFVDCDEYKQNTSAFNIIMTEKEVCIKFSFSSMVHTIKNHDGLPSLVVQSDMCAVFSSGESKSSVYTFVASFLDNWTTQQEVWLLSRNEITPEIMSWFGRQQNFLDWKLKQILYLSESWSFHHLVQGLFSKWPWENHFPPLLSIKGK